MAEIKYTTVYSAEGMLAGEMVKLLLQSFGIQAMIAQESIGQTYGLTVGPMGEVAIMVPESQEKDAKEILASMDSGDLEVGEDDQIPHSYDNKDPKAE
jgi:hypothetical protein